MQIKYMNLQIQKRINEFLMLLKVIHFNPIIFAPYFRLSDSVRLRLRPIDLDIYADKLLLENLIEGSKEIGERVQYRNDDVHHDQRPKRLK